MVNQYKFSSFIFCILICYIPIIDMFLPKTNFGAGIPDFDATRVIFGALFIVFCLESAIQKKMKGFNKWVLIVFLYSFIVILSPVWSKEYEYNTRLIQELFNSVLSPIFILIVALSIFKNKELIMKYMKHFIIAATVLSIISIIQAIFGLSEVNHQVRGMATLNNPNLLAVFLVFSIPCILYSIEKKIILKKIGIIVLSLVVLGIISTISKKGVGTMVLCFIMYFLFKRQYKKIIALFIVSFIMGTLLSGYAIVTNRFSNAVVDREITGKWYMTLAAIKMFSEKPVLGYGYKGYYENFNKYFPNSWKKKYDAHNEFATALANYGIIGITFFLGIFLYPLIYARKIILKSKHEHISEIKKDMAVIVICSIIPFMISAFYAGALFYQPIASFTFYTHASFVFIDSDI